LAHFVFDWLAFAKVFHADAHQRRKMEEQVLLAASVDEPKPAIGD
jgi:hypothetical protein